MNKKESGQGLVEYALILIIVAVVAIVILSIFGPKIGELLGYESCTHQVVFTDSRHAVSNCEFSIQFDDGSSHTAYRVDKGHYVLYYDGRVPKSFQPCDGCSYEYIGE